jgi:hypothetical protein
MLAKSLTLAHIQRYTAKLVMAFSVRTASLRGRKWG